VLALAWLLALPWTVNAHAPDTSYLRAVVSKHALELRFTFDIATLHRIKRLDRDQDGKVTRAEAEAVAPDIAKFLETAVTLELNGQKANLGTSQPIGWPVDAGEFAEEKNYGQTLVHFTFKQDSPGKVIEDFYVLYEVFAQLGAVHRVVANIEQEEKHMEVVFTQFEPDYLYDTFWRAEASSPGASASATAMGRMASFRAGAALVWGFWWLPIAVVMGYAVTLRWTDDRCYKWLLGMAFWFWFLVYFTDSNPTPQLGAATVGAVAAWWLMAFILWPVRTLARGLWRSPGKQVKP
jgi:hypothetical protein